MLSKSLFKYLSKIVNLQNCDFTLSSWKDVKPEFLSDDLQSEQNERIYDKILLICTISKGK